MSKMISNDNGEIYCPNCADQASIAAPGQTTLCKTHADEKHYAEMAEFFDEHLDKMQFHISIPICSRCGKDAYYIGLISTQTSFAFCVDCRDELTLKKNAVIAAQERMSA